MVVAAVAEVARVVGVDSTMTLLLLGEGMLIATAEVEEAGTSVEAGASVETGTGVEEGAAVVEGVTEETGVTDEDPTLTCRPRVASKTASP